MTKPDYNGPKWREWEWWNRRGCLAFVGFALGLMAIVGGAFYAWQRFTEGLLFIIIGLLAILVILKATETWRK
jgi:hypothetical protein